MKISVELGLFDQYVNEERVGKIVVGNSEQVLTYPRSGYGPRQGEIVFPLWLLKDQSEVVIEEVLYNIQWI